MFCSLAKRRPSGAALIHRHRPANLLTKGFVERGDPEAALAGAAVTVSGAIDTSYVEHAYIEPEAGYAYMDGDTLVVVACTQAPYMDRDDTAKVLGLAVDKVRIVPTATGGGFGSKLDVSLQPLIGLVALKTGRPAALAYTRNESMMSTTKRHPGRDEGDHRRRCRRAVSPAWFSTAISTPAPMRAGARPSPTACRCMPPVPM